MIIEKIIPVLLFCLIINSCTVQTKLTKNYKGLPVTAVASEMGNPTRKENLQNGQTLTIYEKSKVLKAAPINTGQFQYDRFESPKSVKTEIFMFYADSSGIISDVKYECKYQR
jgi:hypothetical protein